jgi:hypothetical protein
MGLTFSTVAKITPARAKGSGCATRAFQPACARGRAVISMRNWLVGFIAVAIWLLCFYGQYRPQALNANAPAREFSAGRADAVLARLLGP